MKSCYMSPVWKGHLMRLIVSTWRQTCQTGNSSLSSGGESGDLKSAAAAVHFVVRWVHTCPTGARSGRRGSPSSPPQEEELVLCVALKSRHTERWNVNTWCDSQRDERGVNAAVDAFSSNTATFCCRILVSWHCSCDGQMKMWASVCPRPPSHSVIFHFKSITIVRPLNRFPGKCWHAFDATE